MKVDFVPGHKNPCDYGSRHPDKLPDNLTKEQREDLGIETEEEDMEIWLGAMIQEVLPAITLLQLQDDTDKDPELKNKPTSAVFSLEAFDRVHLMSGSNSGFVKRKCFES